MSSPAYCPSRLVLVARPAEFSQLCRSVLARDPIYGPLLSEVATEPCPGFSALQSPEAQEADGPFLLRSMLHGGSRIQRS